MKKFKVTVNGETFEVSVEEMTAGGQQPSLAVHTNVTPPSAPPASAPPAAPKKSPEPKPEAKPEKPAAPKAAAPAGAGSVTAPMPGNINDVKVKEGDSVNKGDVLLILEAMKMENEIVAPVGGTVKQVLVQKGQTVNNGDLLVVIG